MGFDDLKGIFCGLQAFRIQYFQPAVMCEHIAFSLNNDKMTENGFMRYYPVSPKVSPAKYSLT